MHYDLGYFDDETCRLEPIENPFGPKVLPMCSEYSVTHVTGMNLHLMVGMAGFEPATPRPPVWCASQAALHPDSAASFLLLDGRRRLLRSCCRGRGTFHLE